MPGTPTFIDVASRWLSESAGNVAPGTVEHYRWLLENYVYPKLGDTLDITEDDVKELVEEKLAQGLSGNTVYVIPKLIARILSFASSEGLCEPPAWDYGKSKPERVKPPVILSFDQERRLLNYLTENPKPKHLGIYLLLTTGLSVGELRKLTWADVSVHQKQIRVLMDADGVLDNRSKFRNIPINERQLIYLKKMASLPTVYVASGKPKPASAYALRDNFILVLNELNLPDMPLSDLRRTFAVHCLENGMGYEELSKRLGQKNGRNFRVIWEDLVSPETRERLEHETIASRKVRQAPEHINNIGPDLSPEVVEIRKKVEAKKKQLSQTLACLEGDLEIINALRNNNLPAPGANREGLYRFVQKVLGDDRDGKMLVEYLSCNMRFASMPSLKDVTIQTIRSRVGRGFAKLVDRLDAIYAVEGYDVLEMFHSLTARIQELAPPLPPRPGRKPKLSLENEYKNAMEALERMRTCAGAGQASHQF